MNIQTAGLVRVTFGEIEPGTLFGLAPAHFAYTQFLNVKLGGEGVWQSDDPKKQDVNQAYPFNVVSLDGGRPRTFHDDEKVFICPEGTVARSGTTKKSF